MNYVHGVARRPRILERAKLDLLSGMEREGIATAMASEPTRWVAAEELIEEGLAIEKSRGPLPKRWSRRGVAHIDTLVILPAPNAVGSTPWLIACGRLRPGQKAATMPTDSLARSLGIDTTGPEFEALVDALLSRLMPRVIEALRPPAAADLTADEAILKAIDGRTGFTLDQLLAWMNWPLDRPALRTHLGHVLTRLGFGRSRTKGPLGDLRRTYNAPDVARRSEVADDFADRLSAVLEDFERVTQAEVMKLLGAEMDHSMAVKVGRAMPRIGWRKRVRFANTPERTVEYERERK